MRISVVKKTMTSFKLSDATRAQLVRIREARNKVWTPEFWRKNLTNTDIIRLLLQEEIIRLDAQKEIVEPAKKEPAKIKTKKAKTSTTKSKRK